MLSRPGRQFQAMFFFLDGSQDMVGSEGSLPGHGWLHGGDEAMGGTQYCQKGKRIIRWRIVLGSISKGKG